MNVPRYQDEMAQMNSLLRVGERIRDESICGHLKG